MTTKKTKCDKCKKELKEFNKDYLICNNEECPSYCTMWDRLILKEK